jgi:hypothetical protein
MRIDRWGPGAILPTVPLLAPTTRNRIAFGVVVTAAAFGLGIATGTMLLALLVLAAGIAARPLLFGGGWRDPLLTVGVLVLAYVVASLANR